MKKYLLFLGMVLLCCSHAMTQTIRFTDTTNKWRTVHTSWPNGYPNYGITYYETDDTLVEWGGKQYSVIRSGTWCELWVREDTTTRKVYLKPIKFPRYDVRDTGEFLYMDFSLAVGDSITMPIVNNNATANLSTHTVTHADSVLIGSQWYRRLRLATRNLGYEYYDDYQITEGIGPFAGPLIETRYSNEWGPGILRCFSNNGVIPNPPFTDNCFDPVSIDKKQRQQRNFTVYPNPAVDKIIVRSKSGQAKDATIILSDLTGRKIVTQPLDDYAEIAATQLTRGLYFLHIMEKGVPVQVEKVTVQ